MKIVGDSEHFKQPYDIDEDYVSSKTTDKRDSEAVQKVGMELVSLSKTQLDKSSWMSFCTTLSCKHAKSRLILRRIVATCSISAN